MSRLTIDELLREFRRAPDGAAAQAIAAAAVALGGALPDDYVRFLERSNGGEGPVGEGHLQLWRVEELVGRNEEYDAREAYPGHVLVGSNGAGEAVAWRRRDGKTEWVLMPFIGGVDDAIVGGSSFEEFLGNYASGRIWDRERRS